MPLQDMRYQVKDCYLHRQIAGQDILISLGGNIANFNGYVALNATSSFLWDALSEPKTAGQLVQLLLREFDVEETVAAQDVETFLTALLEKEMVTEVPYGAP